jgi:hypothetical protein
MKIQDRIAIRQDDNVIRVHAQRCVEAVAASALHFSAFTPLTRSQSASDVSPTNAGRRTAGNSQFARGGASTGAKPFVR